MVYILRKCGLSLPFPQRSWSTLVRIDGHRYDGLLRDLGFGLWLTLTLAVQLIKKRIPKQRSAFGLVLERVLSVEVVRGF